MSLEFSPREELEARITALLLGELSAEEEAQLRAAMAQDAGLAQLHERLARTIGLVREAAGSLNDEATTPAELLKLSSERREKLFESFKNLQPKRFAKLRQINWRAKRGELTALAAMVVVLLAVATTLKIQSESEREKEMYSLSDGFLTTDSERAPATRALVTDLLNLSGDSVRSGERGTRERRLKEAEADRSRWMALGRGELNAGDPVVRDPKAGAAVEIDGIRNRMASLNAVLPALPTPTPGVPPVADGGVSVNFGDGANAFGANSAKPRFSGVAPAQAAAASSESVVSPARQFAAIALPKGGDDGLATGIGGIKEGALGLAFDSRASQDFGIPPSPQAGFTILGSGAGGVGGAGGGAAPVTTYARTTFKPETLTDLNRNGDGIEGFGAVKDGAGRLAFGQRLDQIVSRAAIAGDTMTDLAQKPAGAPKIMDDESGRPAAIPGLTPAAPAPGPVAHFDAPDARGDAVKATTLVVADPATRFVNGAEISRPLPAPVSSPAAPVATAGREKTGVEISAASKFANSEYHFEAGSETPRIEVTGIQNAFQGRMVALEAPQRNPVLHPKKAGEDTSKLAPDQTATLGGVALAGQAQVIRRRVDSLKTTEPDTAAVVVAATDPAGAPTAFEAEAKAKTAAPISETAPAAGRPVTFGSEPAGTAGESFFITTVRTNGSAGAVTVDAPLPVTRGFGFVGLGDGSAQQIRAKGLDPKSLGATTALSISGKSLDFDGMGEPPRDWFQAKSQTFDAGYYSTGSNGMTQPLAYAWGVANTNSWGRVTPGIYGGYNSSSWGGVTPAIHKNAGDIGLGDGSAQQVNPPDLRKQVLSQLRVGGTMAGIVPDDADMLLVDTPGAGRLLDGARPVSDPSRTAAATNAWDALADNRFALFGNERTLSEDLDKKSTYYRVQGDGKRSGSGIVLPQVADESLGEKPLRLGPIVINETQSHPLETWVADNEFVELKESKPAPRSGHEAWVQHEELNGRIAHAQKAAGAAGSVLPAGTLKFTEADLAQVLGKYEALQNKTVLKAPSLPPVKVTIEDQGVVTADEAAATLETVLAMNQVTMVPQGTKFVKAVSEGQAFQEGKEFDADVSWHLSPEAQNLTTYVARLSNALPNELVQVLQPFASGSNSIVNVAGTANLVIRDKPENVKRMVELARKLDVVPQQDFVDVVIPMQSAQAKTVAQVLGSLTAGDGGARISVGRSQANTGLSMGGGMLGSAGVTNALLGHAKIIADERSNSLLIFARKQDLAAISNIVQKLDPPVRKPAPDAAIPQPEIATVDNAFSTFSLNVSDVSFKLAGAALEKGQMPEAATVRSEEFINAFDYRDPEPVGSAPVAFAWERARYPFAHNRDLLRFSIKTACSGRQPGRPLNLVLLLDNSGSMERADRVRIIRECLRVLASQLRPEDRVSIVAFARTARLWIDNLPGSQAGELVQRVGELTPQGGTNLEEAMNLAYQTALRHFLANGVNRVVLLTDGAANLGDVNPASLKRKVEAHRQQGVALDCFGIGWEGLNDDLLENLSRNGDGRYGFVNSPEAAATEFAGQLAGALHVAASDVKVQVEFNPKRVRSYRQIGYAKHQLKKEQFRDNTVDAAEIAAAEAGNALYTVEVNPAGEGPLAIVRVRFRIPGTADYREHEWAVPFEGAAKALEQSSATLRLSGAASAFSEWLVSSPFAGEVTPDRVLSLLGGVPETFSADPRPKKLEWMVRQAKSLAGK